MQSIFQELNRNLPLADIPIMGLTSYLVNNVDSQTLYTSSIKDIGFEDYTHANQIGFIFEGKLEFIISGRKITYSSL